MKSLFTNIPLQPVLHCTENAIKNSTVEQPPTYTRHYGPTQPLPNVDVLSAYNGKNYKQLHSTAMGSPVSVVAAEIAMGRAVQSWVKITHCYCEI